MPVIARSAGAGAAAKSASPEGAFPSREPVPQSKTSAKKVDGWPEDC
jgi:hypothetical protein